MTMPQPAAGILPTQYHDNESLDERQIAAIIHNRRPPQPSDAGGKTFALGTQSPKPEAPANNVSNPLTPPRRQRTSICSGQPTWPDLRQEGDETPARAIVLSRTDLQRRGAGSPLYDVHMAGAGTGDVAVSLSRSTTGLGAPAASRQSSRFPSSASLFETRRALTEEEQIARQYAPLERPLSVASNLWESESMEFSGVPGSP